jgi:acetoin utilization protein AcuB
MKPARWTIGPTDSLTAARELMQLHQIRHLPVVEPSGEVVGLVSLGDLYAMEAVAEADPDRAEVRQAMAAEAFSVAPETPLAEVAAQLADRHVGSALVVEGGRLVGLFTASDALRVLARLLRAEVSAGSG